MMIVPRAALAALPLLACAATAHAVPYTLPSGPDITQAKLSGPLPSYTVVCDSLVDSACDVAPGRYQLQVFDNEWNATRSTVNVTSVTEGPVNALPFFLRRESQDGVRSVTATCDGTSRAIGGSCVANVGGVAVPLSEDSTLIFRLGASREKLAGQHTCATDQEATITAEVICFAD